MKEATGELNMTVITLVAITAIAAVFYFVVYPMIQRSLVDRTCKSSYGKDWSATTNGSGTNCVAVDDEQETDSGNSNTKINTWYCCPSDAGNDEP